MSPEAERVLQAALELSYDDRSNIAIRLSESVEGWASPEIEAAWRTEIARRIKEAEERSEPLLSDDEVWRRIDEKFGPLEAKPSRHAQPSAARRRA